MTGAANELFTKARRIIVMQLMIGVLVAAGFFFGKSQWHGVSALYGAVISVISALWLSRGVGRASVHAGSGKKSEAILYINAALRFLMVLALFALGLAVIKLSPLATVAGFVLTQLAFIAAAIPGRN